MVSSKSPYRSSIARLWGVPQIETTTASQLGNPEEEGRDGWGAPGSPSSTSETGKFSKTDLVTELVDGTECVDGAEGETDRLLVFRTISATLLILQAL